MPGLRRDSPGTQSCQRLEPCVAFFFYIYLLLFVHLFHCEVACQECCLTEPNSLWDPWTRAGTGGPQEPPDPELQGFAVIPAGNEMGQGWEVALADDSHSGLGWRRCHLPGVPVSSINTPCSPGPTWKSFSGSLEASEDVLGDPCCSCAGWGCALALPVGQTRFAARTRVRGPSSSREEETLCAL